jgi:hypothetical protein
VGWEKHEYHRGELSFLSRTGTMLMTLYLSDYSDPNYILQYQFHSPNANISQDLIREQISHI